MLARGSCRHRRAVCARAAPPPSCRTRCARHAVGTRTASPSTSADQHTSRCCRSPSMRWAVIGLPARFSPAPTLRPPLASPSCWSGPADLEGRGDLDLIVASEVIEMDDDAAQGVRRKKDSTLVRAAEAVRDGKASAMVSAGNTGATMASALLRMGRIKGVSRPAIATPIPVPGHSPNILLDAGANAEVQPEWLVQFGQMGSVYARHRFGIDSPVGRSPVDRRGARQGRHAAQGGVRVAVARARHPLHRQRRGPRRDAEDRRRDRDRRLHRQRRVEGARRWPASHPHRAARGLRRRGALQAACRRVVAGAAAAVRRRSAPIRTAAPCCSGSTACASSAMARRTRRRCSTPSNSAHEMVEHRLVDEIRAAVALHD